MQCSEMGIPQILAKAKNKVHEKILRSVGAGKVIYPEVEMGKRVAKHIMAENFVDWIDLSPEFSLVEMDIPDSWCGRSLVELQIREKHNLNVIGVKEGERLRVQIDPKEKLKEGTVLIVIGNNRDLERFKK